MRQIDLKTELERISAFIRDYLQHNGFNRVLLGLSGGIDSSLSAAVAIHALGKDNVLGVMLPYKNSSPESYADALLVAEALQIRHDRIEITPMVDAYFDHVQSDASALRRGNWMARIRMCVLYDLSSRDRALVMGTSNRTELLVGYFTQFGDGACAFEPIGGLYKTEVRAMAKLLAMPQRIIDKVPTADLWAGQTDEGELGLSCAELDEILWLLTEEHLSPQEIEAKGFQSAKISRVQHLMQVSEFKRNLPPVPGEESYV